MSNQDVSWIECNIHDNVSRRSCSIKDNTCSENCNNQTEVENGYMEKNKETNDTDNGDEEDKDFLFSLFTTTSDKKFDTFAYEIPIPSSCISTSLDTDVCNSSEEEKIDKSEQKQHETKIITLRGHEEINNSTGLSMWLGSELLAKYILDNPRIIQGGNVVELGAGLGLCGIVSHLIGAKNVILTDGDVHVLSNLRFNVEQNVDKLSFNHTVSCPQLIWGEQDLTQFKRRYGKITVILAADCIYMTQSIEPLWWTINELLSDGDDGIVLYTNRSSSSVRAPIEIIFDTAARYGFKWTKQELTTKSCGIGDDSILSGDVYIFSRG